MDKLKINFVTQANAYLASYRFRVHKPVELLNMCSSNITATITNKVNEEAHVNVFSKHFDPEKTIQAISNGHTKKYYSVFDICDDHFDREAGEYYSQVCSLADLITCSTFNMRKRIKEVTAKDSVVIPDPISFIEMQPKQIVGAPKILWFGHASNLDSLYSVLEYIPYRITVVSNAPIPAHPNIDYVSWGPMVVENLINNFDIVIIPTLEHAWVNCKSPNRVVDSLYSGRYVITNNENVYGEFKDYIKIVDKPEQYKDAIEEYMENSQELQENILKGQQYVKDNYGDDFILDKWLSVFQDLGLIESYKNIET